VHGIRFPKDMCIEQRGLDMDWLLVCADVGGVGAQNRVF
jgi:hypothetical protein